MNAKIPQLAVRLEQALDAHAHSDTEVRLLRQELAALIHQAKAGLVRAPIEWRDVPGARLFTEGGLRKYRDLEQAFADFRLEITDSA
jgi:hypothetical protein